MLRSFILAFYVCLVVIVAVAGDAFIVSIVVTSLGGYLASSR